MERGKNQGKMRRNIWGFRRKEVTACLLPQLEEGGVVVVPVVSSRRNAHAVSYCVRMTFDALPEVEDRGRVCLIQTDENQFQQESGIIRGREN